MREIKFRAWNKELLKMCEVLEIVYGHQGSMEDIKIVTEECSTKKQTSYSYEWRMPEDIVLMQYTGRKDKNGREIYEGDYLRWQDSKDVLEVRWIDASWQVFGSYNKFALHAWQDSEIIGNLYENPELLKCTSTPSPD